MFTREHSIKVIRSYYARRGYWDAISNFHNRAEFLSDHELTQRAAKLL
jgi:hypothetical protein